MTDLTERWKLLREGTTRGMWMYDQLKEQVIASGNANTNGESIIVAFIDDWTGNDHDGFFIAGAPSVGDEMALRLEQCEQENARLLAEVKRLTPPDAIDPMNSD